jgi:hypothetical protein
MESSRRIDEEVIMNKKVYCNNCEYLCFSLYSKYYCSYRYNISLVKEDSWLKEGKEEKVYIAKPQFINQNNDCKWYKKR